MSSENKFSKNVEYYNNNYESFYKRTINTDRSISYKKFIQHLPSNAEILDAGCGVGRDSKFFLSKGFKVTGFDASEKMVVIASKQTGLKILHTNFQSINFVKKFDGVWAEASLLHVPYDEMFHVFNNIYVALKNNGVFYGSYKYGNNVMENVDRIFYNMNEEKLLTFLENFKLFTIVEIWQEKDERSKVMPSKDAKWLNFLLKKL